MKLKKILCIALTILMMSSTLSLLSVSAADGPAAALEGNLIMHWDFEGDTLEEQLANKAVNGDATDSLEFETVGNSTIEDGVANISGLYDEQLVFTGNGVKGAKLNTCSNEYTFYLRSKVSEEGEFLGSTYPYSLFWIQGNNVQAMRCIVQPQGTMRIGPRYPYFVRDTLNTMPADTFWNTDVFADVAITMQIGTDGKCTMTVYSGSTLTPYSLKGNHEGDLMNSFAQFVFASGKKVNTVEHDEYYKEFTKDVAYDDIRVYNKALTFDEIKKVSYEVSGIDPEETVDLGEFTFADDQTTTAAGGDTTTAAGGDTTTAKPAETTSATSKVEVKVGCGSAILGMALIPAAVAVGAVVVSRKKKD